LLEPFVDQSFVDEVINLEWYTGTKSTSPRRLSLLQAAFERLPSNAQRVIGSEGLSSIQPREVVSDSLDPIIRDLRRRKDPDELALIHRSARAGEAAHAAALARIQPGMTELDAFLIVQDAAIRAAGEQVLVYGDFVSGPRCEIERGGPPSHREIKRGDLFLLDFSVVVHGYRTDFANTFVVGAEPSPGQSLLYDICIEALEVGESLLRLGIAAKVVDAAVRGHFASSGLEEFFLSHTGHGIGLGHPEPPYLVRESTETLQLGDVVALEPGLYVPGMGGMRFERNYHITSQGPEKLTRHLLSLGT
jgi:Xaa-Pro aminopeptidase